MRKTGIRERGFAQAQDQNPLTRILIAQSILAREDP
jgi:hypothetical protein